MKVKMAQLTKSLTVWTLLAVAIAAPHSDVLGEAYSGLSEERDTVSVTYALASNSGYRLADPSGWFPPQLYDDLEDVENYPTPGPVEAAEEIPSERQYYDGSEKLGRAGRCEVYVNASACLKEQSCGWCVSSLTCMPGTVEGSLSSCPDFQYGDQTTLSFLQVR